MKDIDAQRAYDNRQEPDPDMRNWREVGPGPEVLEGEDLYHELVRLLQERRRPIKVPCLDCGTIHDQTGPCRGEK